MLNETKNENRIRDWIKSRDYLSRSMTFDLRDRPNLWPVWPETDLLADRAPDIGPCKIVYAHVRDSTALQ